MFDQERLAGYHLCKLFRMRKTARRKGDAARLAVIERAIDLRIERIGLGVLA